MKKTIALIALALSANVFAYSITDSTVLTSASPLLSSATTSGEFQKAQANIVLNDAQEYMQSGRLSAFLSQKIADAQAINEGASESDALEMLLNEAESILK
ncbi:hypothetical protein DOM21_12305 [Bacteriovorax stolpii]|uniref:Uncharacterized protein n=1 Tax=Bacteriovorax stolpii TaxID=960 RepID=A0A2K9NSS8_BACTC|nr:hypothetical protein [Bacteriovorax stolpii]AUN97804.1 hypothetical protein C0V70_06700 [Bacteriovorax stolpii]QDK42212.1 hypothetical protein DOM21_12305 [Bacteriovorax stolpii]TDP51627.1 hypothetical protein C8D79_3071 [Bacteriovorax stolpii]BDT27885.1 hypothetical protein BHI3_13510 [Bacteriovorax sp. HI3]